MKRNAWLVWWCMTLGAGTLGVVLTALGPLSNVRPFETAISQPGARACNPQHLAGRQGVALLGDASNGEIASDCKSALASSWAILYGRKFWRRPAESGTPNGGSALPAHVDVGDIMNRVSHAFEPDTNSACSVVRARDYTARFAGAGLRFAPLGLDGQNLEPDAKIEATFRTRAVRRGEAMLVSQPSDPASQSVLGNTVQRALSPDAGVIEHYEARREGVEICWVLKQPVVGKNSMHLEKARFSLHLPQSLSV